ncbi:MAG TPA: NlpC/P60 family protein [Holophaga sp.]|nr:NlpC/P60 family protein [Holophaga sp.]
MPCFSNPGADVHYGTAGVQRPDRVPVLLVHGALATCRSDWADVVARLEQEHFLVLPEWTEDRPIQAWVAAFAGLVRWLGLASVHLVGHGAGGNLAMHLLLACPELVRTCIVQVGDEAATDPGRPERERPGFGIEQLQSVACPTLVVDGGRLAPEGARLAEHIPEAELWTLPEVDGAVHKAALHAWCERAARFWAWRGDAVSERLHRYRRAHFPDGRQGPFEVRAEGDHLAGTVLDRGLLEEAAAIAGLPADKVQVLVQEGTPWALVQCPVEDLRREPNRLTERMSQALQGEAVRVLQHGPVWCRVRMERDGYIGWIHTHALNLCDAGRAQSWSSACNAKVVACLADARAEDGQPSWKLPFATRVRVVRTSGSVLWIQVPDGSAWQVPAEALEPIGESQAPGDVDIARALDLFQRFVGTPYLWGGRTPFGYDCSGLAGAFYDYLGITLPRDADQQFAKGAAFEGPCRPGDLLFFGEQQAGAPGLPSSAYARHARITHVAISLGGDDFIHADGHHVTCNSLDRRNPRFDAWSCDNYRGARRFVQPA